MRAIVFRGKNDGDWVFGSLTFSFKEDAHYITVHDKDELSFLVETETIGQWTGLSDKNGRLMFEGDIVNGLFLFGLTVEAVVVFRDGAFGLEWRRGKVSTFNAFTSICNVAFEVIGNIHDNPELLL